MLEVIAEPRRAMFAQKRRRASRPLDRRDRELDRDELAARIRRLLERVGQDLPRRVVVRIGIDRREQLGQPRRVRLHRCVALDDRAAEIMIDRRHPHLLEHRDRRIDELGQQPPHSANPHLAHGVGEPLEAWQQPDIAQPRD
ncbi:MAG: hypothetical protein QM831_37780 [Kofleriaceae bacterium]